MSTPSPTPHLDVDTLADLQEGLLDRERVTAVEAHLDGCAPCRATRDAFVDVRLLLQEHHGEITDAAPEDVVRRLDDALAAAAIAPTATASATVVPITATPPRGRSLWHTHALQAAAVFVMVAAIGGLGYGGIKAMSGAGSSGVESAASGGAAGKAAPEARGTGRYSITNSGRDYTEASLRAALPELLAGSLAALDKNGPSFQADSSTAPTSSASPTGPFAAATGAGRLRDGAALASCVANLTGGPVTPLAVDLGRFEGKTATVIVLPDPQDRSFVNIYAVAPDCPTGTWLTYEHVALP